MALPGFDGEWRLIKETPYERVYLAAADESGLNFICKRESLMPSLQAEANAVDANASEGKKWGDGQVAARVPLDIWFRDLAEAKREGDQAYVKRYLNRSENAWMRTFKGNV